MTMKAMTMTFKCKHSHDKYLFEMRIADICADCRFIQATKRSNKLKDQ